MSTRIAGEIHGGNRKVAGVTKVIVAAVVGLAAR
jgi:hypothetical protein